MTRYRILYPNVRDKGSLIDFFSLHVSMYGELQHKNRSHSVNSRVETRQPLGQIYSTISFVNKLLLIYSHVYFLVIIYNSCISTAEVSSYDRLSLVQKNLKY